MADASQPISIEHLIAHLRSDDPRLYEALIMISRGRGVTIPIGSVSGMDEVIAPLELPLTTKGDLLTRDANGLTRVGIKGTREGYVPTVDIRSEAGWSWQAPVSSPVGALTIDVLKAAALIGACDELNFTENGNVALTISIAGKRVTVGVQAIPGSGLPPYTRLWGWDRATTNDFLLYKSSGANVIGDVTLINTTDVDSNNTEYTCRPNLEFFNPASSAAVTRFMLLSNVSITPAAGELLYIVMDYTSLLGSTYAGGIVIAKPGSEVTDFYALQYYTAAMNLYKFVANVSYSQQAGWTAISGYGAAYWISLRVLFNPNGATVGGIPAGGIEVYNGTFPIAHKPMTLTDATVLSGATRVGFFLPGAATLKSYRNLCCRIDAYSVPANYNQFIP